VDYLINFVAGLVGGGFAILVGFALGLSALGTYLAAIAGSLTGTMLFVFGGDRLRSRLGHQPSVDHDSDRLQSIRRRGPVWLGLIGPTFPGVTVSAALGIAAGLDRNRLARWMFVGISVLYGVYTVGLWLIIDG
jgi:hypothetical protein